MSINISIFHSIISQVFSDLFDTIIYEKHGGFKPSDKHKTDLDSSKVNIKNDDNFIISLTYFLRFYTNPWIQDQEQYIY